MKYDPAVQSGSIKVRHANLADVDAYRELRLEALKNHPTAFGQDYAEALLRPPSYWEETLTMDSKEKALFLAEAMSQGQLVGMTGISRSSYKKASHSANIWGVYVRPEWRGNHIAEGLIRSCLTWAEEQGIIIVKLGVLGNNQPAIRCYERCGFKTYGIEPKGLFYEGAFYDGCLMAVEL